MDESLTLRMVAGPECKRCGCRDCQILQQPQAGKTWYPTGRARCRHCGTVIAFRDLDVRPAGVPAVIDHTPVQLPPIEIQTPAPHSTRIDVMQPSVSIMVDPSRCPMCGASAKAYSTKGRVQYRKCPECGKTFKTMKEAG